MYFPTPTWIVHRTIDLVMGRQIVYIVLYILLYIVLGINLNM